MCWKSIPADNCLWYEKTWPQELDSSEIIAFFERNVDALSNQRNFENNEPIIDRFSSTTKLILRLDDKLDYRNIREGHTLTKFNITRKLWTRGPFLDPSFKRLQRVPTFQDKLSILERWLKKFSKPLADSQKGRNCVKGSPAQIKWCQILLADQMEANIQRFPAKAHTLLGLSTENPSCPEGVFSPTFQHRCCENIWPRFRKISRPGNSRPPGTVYFTLLQNSMQDRTRFLSDSLETNFML